MVAILNFAAILNFSGILVSGFSGDLLVQAPGLQLYPEGAPLIWPFLGITIACGAVSGFHSLVSSGTTSKQLSNEKDAKQTLNKNTSMKSTVLVTAPRKAEKNPDVNTCGNTWRKKEKHFIFR